jgi:hypothetical protein
MRKQNGGHIVYKGNPGDVFRQVERAEMGRFDDAIYPVAGDHSGNEDKQSERTEPGDTIWHG